MNFLSLIVLAATRVATAVAFAPSHRGTGIDASFPEQSLIVCSRRCRSESNNGNRRHLITAQRRLSTQLYSSTGRGLAPLQPEKGGIIVEAKSDFVARDVLIDGLMGRGDGPVPLATPTQERDELDIAPNEDSWLSGSSGSSASGVRGQSPRNIDRRQARTPMPPQFQPPPPPRTPPPTQTQARPPQTASPPQQPPPGNSKSKLPDPAAMKLSDIQGELALRRIPHADCFDRVSLEERLREGRATGNSDAAAARRAVGGVASGVVPPMSTKASRGRQSAAEQNIFAQSTRGARANKGQSPGRRSPARGQPFRPRSNFGSGHRPGGRNAPVPHNSSSSFRDNPAGIGFGAANSYTGRTGTGNAMGTVAGGGGVGMSTAAGGGGGDGVSLGKKKTSYGDFGGTVAGSGSVGVSNVVGGGGGDGVSLGKKKTSYGDFGHSIGMGGAGNTEIGSFNARGGGGSSSGGSNASFRSGAFSASGGAGTTNTVGGVEIKGNADIFSSMGFVGSQGGGSTQVYSGFGGGATAAPVSSPNGRPAARPPDPPPSTAQSQLDFLTQASTGGEESNEMYADPLPPPYDVEPSYENTSDDVAAAAAADTPQYEYDASGPPLSQQYAEQGLDMFSGGRDGFGSVQGEIASAGDFSHRGAADQGHKGAGVVGNTGNVMGNFGGGENMGDGSNDGGPVRRGARYSTFNVEDDY